MIELPSLDKLLASLKLNAKAVDCQPMAGGVSASMSLATFQMEDNSLQKWVIRQLSSKTLANRPSGLSMEFSLLGILHRRGIPVPLPVYLDGEGALFGSPTLVLEYLEHFTLLLHAGYGLLHEGQARHSLVDDYDRL